ncbi:MAG: TIGR04219 family outer membrane beta-barrel protein [Gammaproteobacteria bacterium]|nr:TIGR04219 family outer membrane beta-barrel protein [Gammaproteobacteria bacterium]
MRFTKLLLTAGLISVSAMSAYADTVYGVYADANYWYPDASVGTNDKNKTDYDEKGQLMLSANVEHGVPMFPNVYASHTQLNTEKDTTAISKNEVDLTSTDVVAYYEVLDNVVSADVGLGAKVLQGESKNMLVGGTKVASQSLDETLPMAYGSVGAKLPLTGFSAKVKAGYAKGNDVEATDAQAEIKYDFVDNIVVDLGAKAGYRVSKVKYDKKDVKLDSEFKGPYVGLEAHF